MIGSAPSSFSASTFSGDRVSPRPQVVPRVKAAAVILGQDGIGPWQALKLRAFISQCVARAMPVIPVLLPQVEVVPAEALFLRELNIVQFAGGMNDDNAVRRLVW